jgi:hypothetical protein
VVIANNGGFQQPNNCNNDIANLISLNNGVIINPSQDVNNNEHATRASTRNNATNDPEGDGNDLGDLEPSLFVNATDPFEII